VGFLIVKSGFMKKVYIVSFFVTPVIGFTLYLFCDLVFNSFDVFLITQRRTDFIKNALATIASIYIVQKYIIKDSIVSIIQSKNSYFNIYALIIVTMLYLTLNQVWAYSQMTLWIMDAHKLFGYKLFLLELSLIIFLKAFAEEIYFRSFLFRIFENFTNSHIIAILIINITFAAAHWFNDVSFNKFYYVFDLFMFGIMLSILRELYGNLYLPIIIHFFHNLYFSIVATFNASMSQKHFLFLMERGDLFVYEIFYKFCIYAITIIAACQLKKIFKRRI